MSLKRRVFTKDSKQQIIREVQAGILERIREPPRCQSADRSFSGSSLQPETASFEPRLLTTYGVRASLRQGIQTKPRQEPDHHTLTFCLISRVHSNKYSGTQCLLGTHFSWKLPGHPIFRVTYFTSYFVCQ